MQSLPGSFRVLIAALNVAAIGCEHSSTPAPLEESVSAAYGVVRVHFTDNGVVRDTAYPPGVYDVPLDADKALAFDNDSARTTTCARLDKTPFELNGTVKHYRFQCDTSWSSRGVVFVADTQITIKRGEMLEWKKLDGRPQLAPPKVASAADLHSYSQVATPTMLGGRVLVNAAWFSGRYPPQQEFDVLRGDSITFGHYTIRDRVLFIGQSPTQPSTWLFRASDTLQVGGPLEWAFFPSDASEKTESTFSTLYEIPAGYLIRVVLWRDHEGIGVDEFTCLYKFEAGRWRLFAKAERFRGY